MNQEFLAPVLPPEAMAKLDQHDRHLAEAEKMIDRLAVIVGEMRLVDYRRVTLGRVALAADLHRDLSQMLDAVRELTQETTT